MAPSKHSLSKDCRPNEPTYGRPLCFLHFPKAAGISIRAFIAEHFLPDQVYSVPGDPSIEDVDGIANDDLFEFHQRKPHLAYLCHVPYFWLRNFPKKPYVFVVLREPVDRVLSHYYFLRKLVMAGGARSPNSLLDQIVSMEIGEFLQREPARSQVFLANFKRVGLPSGLAGISRTMIQPSHRSNSIGWR